MLLIECEQGTPEWHQARCGVTTASLYMTAVDVVPEETRIKLDGTPYKTRERADGKVPGDPSVASDILCDELSIERISQQPYGDTFQTFAMKRGSEQEMWGRARYEELYDVEVAEAGIALTDDRCFGYSTDGFVGAKGMIEIKTPLSVAKIRAIVENNDTAEYNHQIQGGLWLTGREWCDFIMYVPALEAIGNDIYVKRIYRDEVFIEKLERDLWAFELRVRAAESFWRKQFRRDGLAAAINPAKVTDVAFRDVPPWEDLPGATTAVAVAEAPKPKALRSSLAALLSA